MRSSIIAMLTLALAACASSEPPTTVSAADPNAPVCHRETPTGSNVWHTVCADPQDSDTEKQRALSAMQDALQHSPATKKGATLSNQ